MTAQLVWTDLSTPNPQQAGAFYRKVLGWELREEDGMKLCFAGKSPTAGIYEMPAFFQKIRMPSFWMSYVQVENAQATAARARELGAKVELEEEMADGRIALIRDPAGAGFTCYEGRALAAQRNAAEPGSWCWNELFVSDIDLVRPFYESLFGWRFEAEPHERYGIYAGTERIAAVQVADNAVKGQKEFWAVYFAVADLEKAKTSILAAGGQVEGEFPHEQGTQLLAYDNQGAAFFLLPLAKASSAGFLKPGRQALKWRSALGLFLIYAIVLLELKWAWSLLFLLWVIPDLKSGRTYFLDALDRRTSPILYWAVMITWILLTALMLLPGA